FRTCFNAEGKLGYWSDVVPSYTIFDKSTSLFSSIWTLQLNSFNDFHAQYEKDVDKYSGTGKLFTKTPVPDNVLPISMLPWSSFTAFHLNINNNGDFLLPIITAGKYSKVTNEWLLPVSLQVHHAVSDGYHASVFIDSLQRLAEESEMWICE
ncbi:chloramphenicol acetyltransferase, partial [Paenibacillus riograndensis]